MAELADAADLKSAAARRTGSIPVGRTIFCSTVLALSALLAAAPAAGQGAAPFSAGLATPESQRRAQANFPRVDDRALREAAAVRESWHDVAAGLYTFDLRLSAPDDAGPFIARYRARDGRELFRAPLERGAAPDQLRMRVPPPDVLDQVEDVVIERAPP